MTTIDLSSYLWAGAVLAVLAIAGWIASVRRSDVSIVDAMWSMMILGAAVVYALTADMLGPRAGLILGLAGVWAVRLSIHIGARNRGQGEDRRYRKIRANNEPHFEMKSLYIVFGLQGALAWLISLPLIAALAGTRPLGVLDLGALLVWSVGMVFEVVGDYQLQRFRSVPANSDRVMREGLWRYTRHPNYFGEFLIWWGFFGFSVAAGSWWTVVSPLIMTVLLLKVSGVALLEQDIGERRPGYRDYVARTNTFFPGPPKASSIQETAS